MADGVRRRDVRRAGNQADLARRDKRLDRGRIDASGASELVSRKNFRESNLGHESGDPQRKTLALCVSADSGVIGRGTRDVWPKRDDRPVLQPGHPFMPSLNR